MLKCYDLIVVGGSAVGLYLAKEFSQKGNSVLVLERKKEIGGKVCSGLVSKHIFSFFKKENLGDLIENNFDKARIWIENKYFDFSGEALLFNRQKLDEFLFKEAQKAGAEVQFQKEVIKIEENKDFVLVKTKDGTEFKGKVLAGCDGVLSRVAKEVGLPQQKKLLLGIVTKLTTNNLKLKTKNSKLNFPELFFTKDFPGFFGWKIPRENVIEYGTALEPKKRPKERLEEWLKKNFQFSRPPYFTRRNGRAIFNFQFQAALIPSYPLKKTTTKRIFLCGDAAGQIKPYTGGGLIYGFTAAKIASKVINPQNPHLEIYEKEWRKKLIPEIKMGNFLKKCYSLPGFLKITGVSFLNKLQRKKKLDQDNPLTILKK